MSHRFRHHSAKVLCSGGVGVHRLQVQQRAPRLVVADPPVGVVAAVRMLVAESPVVGAQFVGQGVLMGRVIQNSVSGRVRGDTS